MNYYSKEKTFDVDSEEFDKKLLTLERSGIKAKIVSTNSNRTTFKLIDTDFVFGCPWEFVAKIFNQPLEMSIEKS